MEKSGQCTVIVNPTSGRERAPKYIPLLHSVLSKRFEDITIKLTEKPGDATHFAEIAAKKGHDIICMGGDGTINETINGMVPVGGKSAFGFIPFGTVNDLARALHIPRSPKGAIRMLETAVKTNIDVGKINDRYFINVVAAGLLSEAVGEVTIKEKTLFGSLAYFIQVSSPLIAAMLTDSAGSFRNLIPPEDRNKGVIKLCLFHDFEWLLAIRQAPKLLAGIQMGPDFVTVVSLKKAHISIDENDVLWTNVDGDKWPKFPIDLEILPACLPVFVPKDARDDTVHFPHFFNSVASHIHFPWNENEELLQKDKTTQESSEPSETEEK